LKRRGTDRRGEPAAAGARLISRLAPEDSRKARSVTRDNRQAINSSTRCPEIKALLRVVGVDAVGVV
jgi:hypothetical protein